MNLLACCLIWSSAGFITYLMSYYSKYFPGDFYINYAVQGLAEIMSMWYMKLLSVVTDSIQTHVNILMYKMIAFTLLLMLFTETSMFKVDHSMQTTVVASLIFVIGLCSRSTQNYGYHINTELFPVMMRGQACGILNLVSRPFASAATIIVEYT